jgi:D-tyrosyl-tRNA(Tyr) deacylase
MRAVIQRVKEASVTVDGVVVGSIGKGLMVLVGVGKDDAERDLDWMIEKIINLRIFEDSSGRFDTSLLDIGGELLLVSQFTLHGDCRKGRRPSFSDAMPAEQAREMFERLVAKAREKVAHVETGVFQAMMDVHLVNDGPVTLIIDSRA